MAPAPLVVGIDLGTSHTVVAYGREGSRGAELFAIPQLVTEAETDARVLFPSALYAPPAGETTLDPFGDAPWVLGEHARRRAAAVPGRVVTSSKSWLSYAAVDRTAPILPWGAPEDVPRLSPVEAATRLLAHVRHVWDAEHDGTPLGEQDIVLTVPASFDEVARELTVKAAAAAGLTVRLLEEPQAAFYHWLYTAGEAGLGALLEAHGDGALVLVVDVGGGTTDLSLLEVRRGPGGAPEVDRVAVGPHLLLGGDNMDLALAHAAEKRLLAGQGRGSDHLDPSRFAQLVTACRGAKEKLLTGGGPDLVRVAVAGAGASLVGSTWTTTLTRAEAESLLHGGFFPRVPRDSRPARGKSALVAFGLPYERDPAITRHVAAFLAQHVPPGGRIAALLLNGGVFRATGTGDVLASQLEAWFDGPVTRLPTGDPDLAVALGAVAHGLARRGVGVRIGGGAARSFFVGVDAAPSPSGSAPSPSSAVPRAVCVVPRGAPEGVPQRAEGLPLELVVGAPVRFDLYTSEDNTAPPPGTVVPVDDERFTRLPPLAVALESSAGPRALRLRVDLEGELTPVGTLDLSLVERAPPPGREPRRFRLAFQLGESSAAPPAVARSSAPPPSLPQASMVTTAVERAFAKAGGDGALRAVKDLVRELERVWGERKAWSLPQSRALFDLLLPHRAERRLSPDHERVFWMLAGFCLRPGFGAPGDEARCRALFALFLEKVVFPDQARSWQQFWITWRRVAGGLDDAAQTTLREVADPFLAPKDAGLRPSKKWKPLALDELRDMAASLERVSAASRADLGDWLVLRTYTESDGRLWAAIGRVGARVPSYGSVHAVVPPARVEPWLERLLREDGAKVPGLRAVAVALARVTGDRARDVAPALRERLATRLVRDGASDEDVRPLREVIALGEGAREAFFGESLPVGLRLVER